MMRFGALLLTLLGFVFAWSACGDGDGPSSCNAVEGVVCNNCAIDCNISCAPSETEACVGFTYFGDTINEGRCAFCE